MELATERLILREFVEEDWRAILAYQSTPRYLRFYPWQERAPDDVQAFLGGFLAWQREQPRARYQLAIVRRADGRLIGNCGIRQEHAGDFQAELGYELDPAYWGQGYATEVGRAMLAFGFKELHLHRVWAGCLAENAASAHVLEKLGMRREGHLRENQWMKGRWWDTWLYAILLHEWQALTEPADAGPDCSCG